MKFIESTELHTWCRRMKAMPFARRTGLLLIVVACILHNRALAVAVVMGVVTFFINDTTDFTDEKRMSCF